MSTVTAPEGAAISAELTTPSYSSTIRELLTIAVPLAISSGSVTLMHLANRLFLTWHNTNELAAVLPAAMWNWTLLSIFIGTCQYVNTFVSQYEGVERPDRVSSAVWQGVWFAVVCGLLLTLLAPLTAGVFVLFSHGPEIQRLEIQYFLIVCLGSLPVLLYTVLGCFYSGRQQTAVTMAVQLVGSLVNIVLDYLLIFGRGPFPPLGITGAAIATVSAELSILLIYIVLLWRSPDAVRYNLWSHWRFDRELFSRLLKYGLPAGFHFFVDVFAFSVFILLIGLINPEVLKATTLAFNLNTMAFLPMVGLGTAVSIIVGKRIGEGHPPAAARTTWVAFGIAAAYMLAFGVVYVGFPDLLMAPYAVEENAEQFLAIKPLIIKLLWFVAIYQLFDAMAIVFGSALRGAGDTRFPMFLSFLGSWLVMVLPTWVGIVHWKWGVIEAWCACTANVTLMGLAFLARFYQGRWRLMRVIEVPAPPDA